MKPTMGLATTVLEIGGAQLRKSPQLADLGRYVRQRRELDAALVLVHGGGPEIGELHLRLGLPFRKHRGLRVTAEHSMPLVTMALCGLINKRLVAQLVADGQPALGLSGVDLGVLRASFLNRDALGRVGGPPRVNETILNELLVRGLVPVLAPVCLGPDGGPLNVNADTVAHAVATALAAASLDFVSDAPGVRTGRMGVAAKLSASEVTTLLGSATVSGGMIPKLQSAVAAVAAGVGRVRVGDLTAMIRNTATEIYA